MYCLTHNRMHSLKITEMSFVQDNLVILMGKIMVFLCDRNLTNIQNQYITVNGVGNVVESKYNVPIVICPLQNVARR
jgi:hypothetical protein